MALDRPRHAERPLHLEAFSLVIEHVHLGGIEIAAGRLVARKRIVFPAIPQPEHDVAELLGAGVAVGVRRVRGVAEIERVFVIAAGHHVPAGTAAAQVIERRQHARHRVRLVVGRGRGGDEADMRRHHRQRGQHRERLELVAAGVVADQVETIGAGQPDGVGDEQHVHLRALDGLRDIRPSVSPGCRSRHRPPDAASRRRDNCSRPAGTPRT